MFKKVFNITIAGKSRAVCRVDDLLDLQCTAPRRRARLEDRPTDGAGSCGLKTFSEYAVRFNIEENFLDDQSNGWNIQI